MEVLSSVKDLFATIPLNLFDYILITCLVFYIYEELTLGAKAAISHLTAVVASFLVGLFLYTQVSKILISAFSLSKGLSDAISFVLLAILTYVIVSRLMLTLGKQVSGLTPKHFSKIIAVTAGLLSFIFIASFIISVFLSFPIAVPIKLSIQNSVSGKFLLSHTQNLELAVKQIFNSTIDETLNFLTVKPDSEGTVSLHFTAENPQVDPSSEQEMVNLLNKTRKQYGLGTLTLNTTLRTAARKHGIDMFQRGYFSHYTPEGFSPFDRLEEEGVSYLAAAENLAYAPEVDLAHSGLMKSPGHRKNILDPNFKKVGIGVLDGGIYGKMFVQEFTN